MRGLPSTGLGGSKTMLVRTDAPERRAQWAAALHAGGPVLVRFGDGSERELFARPGVRARAGRQLLYLAARCGLVPPLSRL